MRTLTKLLIPALAAALLLTGCGAPAEVRNAANDYAEKYTDDFSQKVTDTYGNDAHVKNVKGVITKTKDEKTKETVYHANGDLSGALFIGQKLYNAVYHPDTNRMETTYSSETVHKELVNALPFDQTQFLYDKTLGADGIWPAMYDSSVVGIESAAVSDCTMHLYVITKEDLSTYTYAEIQSIDVLNRIAHGGSNCKITVVSVEDEDMVASLKSNITKYDFSSDNIPSALTTSGTAFEEYHIKNSIYISFQNENVKCNYLSK